MVTLKDRHSCSSASDTTFWLDTPIGCSKPTDVLRPEFTRREVLEEFRTLHYDTTSHPEKVRWLILFELCEYMTYFWQNRTCVTLENRPENKTDQSIYTAYLKGREFLVEVFEDAQRRYQASLAGGTT